MPEQPSRNLAMELVRVTESAALAAARWVGRGDKNGVDGAAVDAMRQLRDELHRRLIDAIPDLILNGHPAERLPNTLHVSFPGVSGRTLLHAVGAEVAASVGSACHAEGDAVSGVLAAMGIRAVRAVGAVRLSVGMGSDAAGIEVAATALIDGFWRLRS